MALVSGKRSTLNPNAPLFIPAVFHQVEDFSPEWWDLVKTSTWFRDYWIDQHQEEEYVDSGDVDVDVADFLPDSIDLGIDDDFSYLESEVEELVEYSETKETMIKNPGLELDLEPMIKNQGSPKSSRGSRSPVASPKYFEKLNKAVSPRSTPRRIHQPR